MLGEVIDCKSGIPKSGTDRLGERAECLCTQPSDLFFVDWFEM